VIEAGVDKVFHKAVFAELHSKVIHHHRGGWDWMSSHGIEAG